MSKANEYIKRLNKRIDHLENRIEKAPIDLSYDKAEVSALKWILNERERLISLLEAKYERSKKNKANPTNNREHMETTPRLETDATAGELL